MEVSFPTVPTVDGARYLCDLPPALDRFEQTTVLWLDGHDKKIPRNLRGVLKNFCLYEKHIRISEG
jgi:hypothetical protein